MHEVIAVENMSTYYLSSDFVVLDRYRVIANSGVNIDLKMGILKVVVIMNTQCENEGFVYLLLSTLIKTFHRTLRYRVH